MNLNTLNYVITIAEEGNFTRAARKLFISQPTLSQSIQLLENQLGTRLFDRNSTPIKPTPAGEEYIAWARQVLDSEAQTMRRISDIVQNKDRSLVVGVSPYRSLRILPEVLKRFYAETEGNCRITLVEQRSSEYVRLMEEGKLDLLIDKPVSDDSPYEAVTLTEEKILLAVPEAYRLPVWKSDTDTEMSAEEKEGEVWNQDRSIFNRGGELTLGKIRQEDARLLGRMEPEAMKIHYDVAEMESLRDMPVIMLSEKQHMGRSWRQVFDILGHKPRVVLECQSIEMAFLMARQGLGLTLVPESVIRFMPPDPMVHYYILKDYPLSRTMAVLYPKRRYLSQDARRFIELLKEVVSGENSGV